MEEDKYITGGVPKKVTFSVFCWAIPEKTFWTMIAWIVLSLPILATIILGHFWIGIKIALFCVLIVFWILFFKFFSSNKAIDRSMLYGKFLLRGIRGERVLCKFTQDVEFLKKYIPIKAIHNHGLIEYTNGSWLCMFDVTTPQLTEDELHKHLAGIRGCIDSLYDDMSMITRAISVMNVKTSYAQKLLDRGKNPMITTEQKEHLFDLDTHIRNKSQNAKVWHISIVLNLGYCENEEDGQIKLAQTIPGFIDSLHKAGDDAVLLTRDYVIYEQMRKMMLPM